MTKFPSKITVLMSYNAHDITFDSYMALHQENFV